MVRLGDVEGYLGGELLLKKSEALQDGRVVAGDVDEEVVLIECLEFDLDVGGLHDLVDLAVLLAADELPVLVRELNLEAYLVVEGLNTDVRTVADWECNIHTFTMSSSRSIDTALRTSCSSPCISKHMPLNTTSAPLVKETCFKMVDTCVWLRVVDGSKTLN